ncbi:MAG: ABC transporter permease, partial [Lachnospiraceae bacterium]|nr:ABC transporter permease [Lachnospiraceae bacterium]
KALSGQGSTSDTYEILITKNVADKLLKNPTFSFINSYDDLVGMFFESGLVDSKKLYERMMRHATGSDDQEKTPNYVYDPEMDRYYYYNSEDDSFTYLDYDEIPEEEKEKQHYFRIAGVLDSDELVVYLNEDMFTDSVLSLSMPDGRVLENYGTALVFSDDPDKTVSYLDKLGISSLAAKRELEEELRAAKGEMAGYLSTMAILLAVLCVCMYFIMRAVYMNRMKEIGTYRAIGVSKRNMLFRSFVETGVMTTLSAFVGYLLTVGFIAYLRSFSSKTENFFYMPWWLAILVLLLIYVICLFSGTISVRSVLRKTPAEIMAKYDI